MCSAGGLEAGWRELGALGAGVRRLDAGTGSICGASVSWNENWGITLALAASLSLGFSTRISSRRYRKSSPNSCKSCSIFREIDCLVSKQLSCSHLSTLRICDPQCIFHHLSLHISSEHLLPKSSTKVLNLTPSPLNKCCQQNQNFSD